MLLCPYPKSKQNATTYTSFFMKYVIPNHSKIRGGQIVMCVKRIGKHAINKFVFLENDERLDFALTEASVSDSPRKHCNVLCPLY